MFKDTWLERTSIVDSFCFAQFQFRAIVARMRRTIILALLVIGGLVGVEVVSSYVLFRYDAHHRKSLDPRGSAALMLAKRTISKVSGKYPAAVLWIDHGPIFDASEAYGFAVRPGRYRIKEQLGEKTHAFGITITDERHRATSYFPRRSDKRIFMAGDSSMFGWGLNDEQTIPWLIQERLPNFDVVNLSLSSYSPVHALLQLQQVSPRLGPDDIVVIDYHDVTNQFIVMSADVLRDLGKGFEFEIGNAARMREAKMPYGSLDEGKLSIRHVSLSCAFEPARPGCPGPKFDLAQATPVTKRVFDEILALHPGHLVIIFQFGADSDPVIEYLRTRGAMIVDLRSGRAPGEEGDDIIATDTHMGPFGQYQIAERLFDAMHRDHVVD